MGLRAFQGQLRKMLPLAEELLQAGEVQEPDVSYAASQGEQAAGPIGSRFRIDPYGRRNHALYDGKDLVAVMAYKRGAVEVKRRFEALEQEIARLKEALSEAGGRTSGGGAARGSRGTAPSRARSWKRARAVGRRGTTTVT
jgi:hypothetical protein